MTKRPHKPKRSARDQEYERLTELAKRSRENEKKHGRKGIDWGALSVDALNKAVVAGDPEDFKEAAPPKK